MDTDYPCFETRLATYNDVLDITHYYDIPDSEKDFWDEDFRFGNKVNHQATFADPLSRDIIYEDFSVFMGVPHVPKFSMKIYQLSKLSTSKNVVKMTGLSRSIISMHYKRAKYLLRGGFNYIFITNKKRDLHIGRILVKNVSLSTTTGETKHESNSPNEASSSAKH